MDLQTSSELAWNPPYHSMSATHGESSLALSTPSITITDATPTKRIVPSLSQSPIPASSSSFSYRLLYRGALSLPDSHILLDGLTFSARLPGTTKQSLYDSPSNLQSSDSLTRDLIHNPLALALESMRGRPSLRFRGTVRLKDIWMDENGEVYMCVKFSLFIRKTSVRLSLHRRDIHDSAILSRVYFENILCLSPLISVPCGFGNVKRTEVGVRVTLGDTGNGSQMSVMVLKVIFCIQMVWKQPKLLFMGRQRTLSICP